jgi:phosphatidylserine decarboxylase
MDTSFATPWEKCKAFLFHLFPHHFVSRCTYWLTRRKLPFTKQLINLFIRAFKVDMQDALIRDTQQYSTFNEFFTRELSKEARPVDSDPKSLVSPCDGRISLFGDITANTLLQAKGKHFTLTDFCTDKSKYTNEFIDGVFCTIYLSPRDYHRVHMPCEGKLVEMIYIPGRLFSVAPYAPKAIDRLYARNERVVSIFKVKQGYMALAMVGAVNVAAIEMAWEGLITPPHLTQPGYFDYTKKDITLTKGAYVGTFNMGSTVVLLFSKNLADISNQLKASDPVKMGEAIGAFV